MFLELLLVVTLVFHLVLALILRLIVLRVVVLGAVLIVLILLHESSPLFTTDSVPESGIGIYHGKHKNYDTKSGMSVL